MLFVSSASTTQPEAAESFWAVEVTSLTSQSGSEPSVAPLRSTWVPAPLENESVESGAVVHATPHDGESDYGEPAWLPDSSGFFAATNEGSPRFWQSCS